MRNRRYGRDEFSPETFAYARSHWTWGLNAPVWQNNQTYLAARDEARQIRDQIRIQRPVGAAAALMWRRWRTYREIQREAYNSMREHLAEAAYSRRYVRHNYLPGSIVPTMQLDSRSYYPNVPSGPMNLAQQAAWDARMEYLLEDINRAPGEHVMSEYPAEDE